MNAESLVQWTYPESDITAFLLERSVDAGATWPVMIPFSFTASNYVDTDIVLYGHYWYKIAGVNPKGTGSFSNLATVFFKPPDPQLFAWQNGSYTTATMFWNYLGTFSMSVSRSSDGGVTWPVTAVATPTSQSTYYYIDNTPVLGQTYTYRIKDMADPALPSITADPITINSFGETAMAFSGDGGFEAGPYTPWEIHTASRLDMNNQIRGRFSASRFLLGGDNGVQGYSVHQGYQGQCFALSGPSESIWAVMGNHDVSDMGGAAAFKNYFGYRAITSSWVQGPIQGFSLYSISEADTSLISGGTQWTWLSRSLSSSMQDPTIAWRIAIIHPPVISSLFVHPGNPTEAAVPWREWGIDAVFSGHNHSVERLESSSVAFITCGGLSNEKSPYGLQSLSPYSQWVFTDAISGGRGYSSGYVYTLIQATDLYMSMSFYSSSIKLPDTGSTAIFNATMSGNSLILRKMPPQGDTVLTATLI
jgi:hypothetical protein